MSHAALIERLEEQAAYDKKHYPPANPLFTEAAQAIRDLGAKVAHMTGAVETAQRVLKAIPAAAVNDGAMVAWPVSDDVPEDIHVALSYLDHALQSNEGGA